MQGCVNDLTSTFRQNSQAVLERVEVLFCIIRVLVEMLQVLCLLLGEGLSGLVEIDFYFHPF